MSDKLAVSSALSVLMMALFALFGAETMTREASGERGQLSQAEAQTFAPRADVFVRP